MEQRQHSYYSPMNDKFKSENSPKNSFDFWIKIVPTIGLVLTVIGLVFNYNSNKSISIDKAQKLINELEYAYVRSIEYKDYYKAMSKNDKHYEKLLMKNFNKIVSKQYKEDILKDILEGNYNPNKYEYQFNFGNIEVQGYSIIVNNPTMTTKERNSDKNPNQVDLKPRIYKLKKYFTNFKIIEKIHL